MQRRIKKSNKEQHEPEVGARVGVTEEERRKQHRNRYLCTINDDGSQLTYYSSSLEMKSSET